MSFLIVLITAPAFYVINGTFHIHTYIHTYMHTYIHTHTQITGIYLASSHTETNSATKPPKQMNNNKDELTVSEV
jgi:hypothetical protein